MRHLPGVLGIGSKACNLPAVPLPSLQSLVWYTRDVPRLSAFYAAVLDLAQATYQEQAATLLLDTSALVFTPTSGLPSPGNAPTPWFAVPDLFAAIVRAKGAGAVERLAPERREGVLVAAFRDPDGNIFGLRQS